MYIHMLSKYSDRIAKDGQVCFSTQFIQKTVDREIEGYTKDRETSTDSVGLHGGFNRMTYVHVELS